MSARSSFFKSLPVRVGCPVLVILLVLGLIAHPVGASIGSLALSVLIASSAVGLGVVVASLASPGETSEGTMFKVVAGVLLTFASGFLLKNFDSDIKSLVTKMLDGEIVYAARFWLFVSSFVAASIFSYVFRAYFMTTQPTHKLAKELSDDLSKLQEKVKGLSHSQDVSSNRPRRIRFRPRT